MPMATMHQRLSRRRSDPLGKQKGQEEGQAAGGQNADVGEELAAAIDTRWRPTWVFWSTMPIDTGPGIPDQEDDSRR